MKWYERNVDMPVFVVFLLIGYIVLCTFVTIAPRIWRSDSPETVVDEMRYCYNEGCMRRGELLVMFDGQLRDCADSIAALNEALGRPVWWDDGHQDSIIDSLKQHIEWLWALPYYIELAASFDRDPCAGKVSIKAVDSLFDCWSSFNGISVWNAWQLIKEGGR